MIWNVPAALAITSLPPPAAAAASLTPRPASRLQRPATTAPTALGSTRTAAQQP